MEELYSLDQQTLSALRWFWSTRFTFLASLRYLLSSQWQRCMQLAGLYMGWSSWPQTSRVWLSWQNILCKSGHQQCLCHTSHSISPAELSTPWAWTTAYRFQDFHSRIYSWPKRYKTVHVELQRITSVSWPGCTKLLVLLCKFCKGCMPAALFACHYSKLSL